MKVPKDFNAPVPGPHYYHVRYTDGTLGFVARDRDTGKAVTVGDRFINPVANPLMDYHVLEDMGCDDGTEFFMQYLDRLGARTE